ncbi:chemotaxis protein CheW [Tuberibacillus sp. Marseille-P3662]|uniref:chemotaxis protein CheW n=1 Tax=Tuberibacillus sp. Marseille-P3662 TaxID=1965358 RepID=UPI000A1C8F26|nr:chemotaxis protein CheW [Tuberibacillus sp. Marseille-P3662]
MANDIGMIKMIELYMAELSIALPAETVLEIIEPKQTQPLPKTPPAIEGVFHLRGEVYALIDLYLIASGQPLSANTGKYIIINPPTTSTYALHVSGVSRMLESTSMPLQESVATNLSNIESMADGVIQADNASLLLLNPDHLFNAIRNQPS